MEHYYGAVGCFMYLVVATRPDPAHSMCILAKFVETPTLIHWVVVWQFLSYILETNHFGLRQNDPVIQLVPGAYVDGDWAGDVERSKSVIGCLVIMCGAALYWVPRPQEVNVLWSTEAD